MGMLVLEGNGVYRGVAFGKVKFLKQRSKQTAKYMVEDVEHELSRFEYAKKQTLKELDALFEKALKEVGDENALIFDIHKMMVEDLDYNDSVRNIINEQKVNAEHAVNETCVIFADMFASMDDEYMRGRAADVKDISKRIIANLSGEDSTSAYKFSSPVVVAADDLAPSETVQLDKKNVLAFVTRKGSASSHTAILARTMNIPAVIGVGDALPEDSSGCDAIIDGFDGKVYINPDEETIKVMTKKKEKADKELAVLNSLRGKENISLDGQNIDIYANIGDVSDLDTVDKNDAGGVGLFRSEFIYLGSKDYPTEEEQFAIYKEALQRMKGKRVVVRTLDIGADKQIDYFNMPKEENPAMGMRALRICLQRPQVFKTQLRALLRASTYGRLAIMLPMVISVDEIKKAKALFNEIKSELDNENISYDKNIEFGIMIETPAAAVISDKLAKEVDFFSIGTNDLSQYTEAIDRQNPNLGEFFNPHHLAVLRLIKTVVDNAHKEGIWAGICGELGADQRLTELFLAIGVDELSVSPGSVLPLRKIVRETDVSKIRKQKLDELV